MTATDSLARVPSVPATGPVARALALHDRLAVTVFDRLRAPVLLFVRLTWGWLFFETGRGKLGNLAGVTEFFTSLGIPMPGVNALVVGLLECFGGLLLALGFGGRAVALLLTGNMAVAYLTAHRDTFGDLRAFTGAEPYPYLLASLLVLAFGSGALSIDELLRRRRARA